MWSDADKLLLNATPRILSELSRVMSGSGGGRVFKFPRSPVVAEEDFLGLRFLQFKPLRLFSAAQAAMLSISAALLLN